MEYCDESVCVCVCVSVIVSPQLHVRSSPVFCACYLWSWRGPPLMAKFPENVLKLICACISSPHRNIVTCQEPLLKKPAT